MPTSFQSQLAFKPKPERILEEFSFDGGLITDAHETKLLPNQSPDLANVVFNDSKTIKTRNGYLRYNNDPVEALSNQSNTTASSNISTLVSPTDYTAQTFQVAADTDVLQINVYLSMANAGEEQYVKLELWSAGPGSQLIDGQILLVSGTAEATYKYRFREPYTLTASTEYAIVTRQFVNNASQSTNTVKVYRTLGLYASGAAYTSSDSGSTWSTVANADFKFDVLTGTATGSTGLMRYYNSSGAEQLLAKFGTSLYRGNDGTGAMTPITLGSGVSLTAANFIDWTIVNDTLLVVDGTNKIQKYRGSTNSNYATGTITATNTSAIITGSGTSWSTATNAEVGEYIQLPDGKWYKITSIASDTSLTIEVSYKGSTVPNQAYKISPWGEVQGRFDATAPSGLVRPTPSFIASHINRVWVLQDNALYFSTLDTTASGEHFNDFDTANNAGQINIPAGKGDTGTGLYSINNSLYIFQRNAVWVLLGSSPANFELRNVSNEVGLVDRRTVVEYDTYLIFFSGKDIYIFDGSNLKNLSINRVHSLISSWANITSPAAVLWGNRYMLSYTPSGGSVNSETLFYDIAGDKFGKIEGLPVAAWSVWNGGSDSGQIYCGSSRTGAIYRWAVGGHDDGYEIETRYSTPSLGLGVNMNDKVVKRVYLQQLALGNWDMATTQYSDITADTISSSISLSTGTDVLWDVAQWDVDSWPDEGSLITTRITEFQGTAKYLRYLFSQTGYDEGLEILGLNVTARTRRLT